MVGIVSDSSCNLPAEVIEELGIEIVPLNVHVGTETYEETEVTTAFLCQKMREGVLPKTSQPAPGKFLEAFERVAKKCDSIIAITITSVHSGTYGSALLARNMLPDVDIEVVDSRSVSMGMGFQVEWAARAAKAGKSKEEVLAVIKKTQEFISVYATVETLHYLHMGGRVGAVKTLMASLLDIKPILVVKDGEVKVSGQTRTRRKSLELILNRSIQAARKHKQVDVAVLYADSREDALMLKEGIEKALSPRKLYLLEVTAVLTVHGGPGLLGIVSCPVLNL